MGETGVAAFYLRWPIRVMSVLLLAVILWRQGSERRLNPLACWLPVFLIVATFERPRLVPKTTSYRLAVGLLWLCLALVGVILAWAFVP